MDKSKTFWEALNADDHYREVQAGQEKIYKQIEAIQDDMKEKFWEVQSTLAAVDLVTRKIVALSPEHDEVLVEATGQCSDCWGADWQKSQDVLFAFAERLCREVTELSVERGELMETKERLQEVKNSHMNRIRREFHAMQES